MELSYKKFSVDQFVWKESYVISLGEVAEVRPYFRRKYFKLFLQFWILVMSGFEATTLLQQSTT